MKVCFPVEENKGLDSLVYNHFGSAPLFVIIDTESETVTEINNGDLNHQHGMCNPLKALSNYDIDAVVLGGIGLGALSKLNNAGITVYKNAANTIKENITLIKDQKLEEMTEGCSHNHGHSCH